MALMNLGVKALLGWISDLTLPHREIKNIEELQNGELLLHVVYKMKKEQPPSITSPRERFKAIAEFVEQVCRFSATQSCSLSWDNINNGINLTLEIAKVLLLLVYHDMMSERCTLKTLDCEVEGEIANLTVSYVMESEGRVYLSSGLDAYLARQYLPVTPEIFARTTSTSTSSLSTASTLSDEDSPVFHRTKKIAFVDMHTVASSSSRSPLQDIMNTPKFQLRKIQREMIRERDYRDGLEKELAGKISLIAQRESHINQLQYHLDKMKREQTANELSTREQINDLEMKNNLLQQRLNELLKENKESKSSFSLTERKVNELEEENGVLSSQMRTVRAQLSMCQAEVLRLTESQASLQEEWRTKEDYLNSELSQATAQKELLTEQIQILQGKISCLEEEIRAATKQDLGENMGPIIERDELDCEIVRLKNELDSTFYCLKKAEANVEAKTQQLSDFEQKNAQQKEQLEQQKLHIKDIVQAKDRILMELQKEISEQRATLQKEIEHLKFQLEQAEQQKAQEISGLQKLIAALQQELDTFRESSREKEQLLDQTKQKLKELETKFHDLTSVLVDKDNQINILKEEINVFTIETVKTKNEIETKDQLLSQLHLESSNQQDILQNQIQTLTVEVENLGLTVQRAKQEVQLKRDLLAQTKQEYIKEKDVLQQQIATSEEETCRLRSEIYAKNEQLVILQTDTSNQSEILQEQMNHLKSQVESLTNSLTKAEDNVKSLQELLVKQEQESAGQQDLLQQKLIASEESVRTMQVESQTKEDQIILLNKQFSKKSERLHQDIQSLEEQVKSLSLSLRNAEGNLKSKGTLFAEQHSQSTLQIEALQTQMVSSQQEVSRLISQLHDKEEQLSLLANTSSEQSELLEKKINGLDKQLESVNDSLQMTKDQVKAKEDLIAKLEKENSFHTETLKKDNMELLEEAKQLKEELQTKESQFNLFKVESSEQSEVLKNEIEALKNQIKKLTESLQATQEQVKANVDLLANKEMEISKERNKYESLMESSSEEVTTLKERIRNHEKQLVTLKERGSSQTEMLQKEMSQLKEQLALMNNLLSKAEQRVQAQLAVITAQEQECAHQKELLQYQQSVAEAEIRKMTAEIQVGEECIMQLNVNSEESGQEVQSLKEQVQSLEVFLRKAEEVVQSKNELLNQQKIEIDITLQEKHQKDELKEKQISSFENEILKLRECCDEKQTLLIKTEEQLDMLKSELVAVKTQSDEKDHSLDTLSAEVAAQAKLLEKSKQEAQDNANMLVKIQDEASQQSIALQLEVDDLKRHLEVITQELQDKGQELLQRNQGSAELMENLKMQLSASQAEVIKMKVEIQAKEEYVMQLKDANFAQLNLDVQFKTDQQQEEVERTLQNDELLQKQISSFEEEILKLKERNDEKQELLNRAKTKLDVLQTELVAMKTITDKKDKDQKALEKEVAMLILEKERLVQTKQATERENLASLKMEQVLKEELESLKMENALLLKEMEKKQETRWIKKDLEEQLVAKTEAVEHYKAQMEKAVSHYNDKKQLLQESQEEVAKLKHTLEVKEREVNATGTELKLLQLQLEKAQSKEKDMLSKLARLEAQVAFSDLNLLAHNQISDRQGETSELPDLHSKVLKVEPKRMMSSDSLNQSSLEDSLNSTRKLSAPGESSTPLVRSSERLAAKRRGLKAESLESLYFTPINTRHVHRATAEIKTEMDFRCLNPSSSVKRRRTTQVINITMTKKTPGGIEHDETFYSLASAQSQPNLSGARGARPAFMELSDTPAKMTEAVSDQLSGLPGYRRSTIHSQTTSTFCVGAVNEPEGAPDDWMRIAEFQARNKACLPHLKSSYPVEFENGFKTALTFTDEDVRTGDPTETIRRASVMPGQLQESVASHRLSLAAPHLSSTSSVRSHRLSLMAGYPPSKSISSSQLKSPRCSKRSASTLSVTHTSPEKKMKATCFPRPLTPKNKNMNSGSTNSNLHPTLSPVDRRESMMFTIENTPKNSSNYLKRGLNKLRSSTRKSPGKTATKSPVKTAHKENKQAATSRAVAGRAARVGSFKSPQVVSKENKKTCQTFGKSPRLTESARKVKKRMLN
ncbi:nuclear mitotic apparatus protein 1 isoform X2 [Syngnathus scovelli]|uniref:nuclear mitotic apparatus protein 1 isoform X2 n=1 Tax=Syngnathus scovelli TaxID=161590 RepID=UPI00211020CA|nr:nuclear mitotic apparatus protein 1-like isoform X2 [Syngnathus scovelli]